MRRQLQNVIRAGLVATSVAALPGGNLAAQEFPSRPVRIITTAATGTTPDIVMRMVAEPLIKKWKQQIVVENMSSAGGLTALQQVVAAPPDGHTLIAASASSFTLLPLRQPEAPIESVTPIALLGELPMAFAVSKTLGVNSLRAFVEKSRTTDLFYAANAAGNLPHLSGAYFAAVTGARMTFVPFKSTTDALVSVRQGQVGLIIENYPSLEAGIENGDLALLAYGSERRLPNFPDVATVAEEWPGFKAVGWAALAGPPGLPATLADKINSDVSRAMATIQDRLQALGVYPVPCSAAQLREYIVAEQKRWRTISEQISRKQE